MAKSRFCCSAPPTLAEIGRWLVDLPDWTARHRSGLGDLTIRHEWQQLCRQNRKRRVYVWSKERHLQECDSER